MLQATTGDQASCSDSAGMGLGAPVFHPQAGWGAWGPPHPDLLERESALLQLSENKL